MKENDELYIPETYFRNVFNLFFEALNIITLEEDYKFVKYLSDRQVECVLTCLVKLLTLKSNKKDKPVLPSVDFIVKKMKLGFDSVKNMEEKYYEKIDIHLLSVK